MASEKPPDEHDVFWDTFWQWWDLGIARVLVAIVAALLFMGLSYGWALVVALVFLFFSLAMATREIMLFIKSKKGQKRAG